MRLVKLSKDKFADEAAVDAFFTGELSRRTPPGLFLIGQQIAADGLAAGETVLFSYDGRLRFVARAISGREDNIYLPQADYPHCIVLNPGSVRRADGPIPDLERRLAAAGVQVPLRGRGWTRLPDGEPAASVIEVKREEVASQLIRQILDGMISFRPPLEFPPAPCFVKRHWERVGLGPAPATPAEQSRES